MKTGLQLGSLLLHIGSQMMDLTWSNKESSWRPVSIFETVIENLEHYKQEQLLKISTSK